MGGSGVPLMIKCSSMQCDSRKGKSNWKVTFGDGLDWSCEAVTPSSGELHLPF